MVRRFVIEGEGKELHWLRVSGVFLVHSRPEGRREDDTMLVEWGTPGESEMQQGVQLQEENLDKEFNSENESEVYLKCIHLDQVQRCADLPLQATLPTHTEQRKVGTGFE